MRSAPVARPAGQPAVAGDESPRPGRSVRHPAGGLQAHAWRMVGPRSAAAAWASTGNQGSGCHVLRGPRSGAEDKAPVSFT